MYVCLCYSHRCIFAKTASLNVSGTVGFNAHNCEVKYTASVANAMNENGNAISETASSPNVLTQTEIKENTAWTLGTLYFDDLTYDTPKQIILTINLYNYSIFPIKATATALQTMTTNTNYSKLNITITNCNRIDEKEGDVVSNGVVTIAIDIKDLSSSQFELPLAFDINITRNTEQKKDYSISINEEYSSLLEAESPTGINVGETTVLKFKSNSIINQPIVLNAKSKWEKTTSGYTLTLSNATGDVNVIFGDAAPVTQLLYRTQDGNIDKLTEPSDIASLINIIQGSYLESEDMSGFTKLCSLVIDCKKYMLDTDTYIDILYIDELQIYFPYITSSTICAVKSFVDGRWIDYESTCSNGTIAIKGLRFTPDQGINQIDIFKQN